MRTKIHIELDVHKNSIAPGLRSPNGSQPQNAGRRGGANLAAERGLLKLMKMLDASKWALGEVGSLA